MKLAVLITLVAELATLPELGRRLFYDARLSVNGTQSCASCHQQERAFTDGRRVAIGSTGQRHTLNTPTLTNVGSRAVFGWKGHGVRSLEQQTLVPMFNRRPVELGFDNKVLARLRQDEAYVATFRAAFPKDRQPVSTANIARALAAFQRTLISDRSPWDKAAYALEHEAMPPSAWRGARVFFSRCAECHSGRNFTLAAGPVRVATLRNVELTGPYLHDGSAATLEEVIDRRYATLFALNREQRVDLVAFLISLTDREFVSDARHADPDRTDVNR